MEFDRCPSNDPLCYPGVPVPASCLLIGSWLYPLDVTDGHDPANWTVRGGGRLDAALAAAGATPMAGRRPLLAVGSNAAPAQLRHKYRAGWERTAIPITQARVHGLTVAYSAHVSVPGYLPYLPVLDSTAPARTLNILWLDDDQLRRMDQTELSYQRVVLPPSLVTAEIGEQATPLPTVQAYRGRWGALRREPGGALLPATTQHDVYTALSVHGWFRVLVPELDRDGPAAAARSLAHDPARRDRIRHELRARNLAGGDGLSTPAAAPRLARRDRFGA